MSCCSPLKTLLSRKPLPCGAQHAKAIPLILQAQFNGSKRTTGFIFNHTIADSLHSDYTQHLVKIISCGGSKPLDRDLYMDIEKEMIHVSNRSILLLGKHQPIHQIFIVTPEEIFVKELGHCSKIIQDTPPESHIFSQDLVERIIEPNGGLIIAYMLDQKLCITRVDFDTSFGPSLPSLKMQNFSNALKDSTVQFNSKEVLNKGYGSPENRVPDNSVSNMSEKCPLFVKDVILSSSAHTSQGFILDRQGPSNGEISNADVKKLNKQWVQDMKKSGLKKFPRQIVNVVERAPGHAEEKFTRRTNILRIPFTSEGEFPAVVTEAIAGELQAHHSEGILLAHFFTNKVGLALITTKNLSGGDTHGGASTPVKFNKQ